MLHPNAELTAIAWLAQVPGLNPAMTGTTLPADNTTWAASGFVVATAVAGTANIDVPLRRSLIQVDCWANNRTSTRPPWGKAAHLAETILAATWHRDGTQTALTVGPAGTNYRQVNIREVTAVDEPRRVIGDEAGYGRYTTQIVIAWTEIPE